MKLFSDKLLIKMYNMTNKTKPNNKLYRQLLTKLRGYPKDFWYDAYIVPYDFILELKDCSDLLDYGLSSTKATPLDNGLERYFYRMSVLPKGNRRRSYYRFIVEGFDERMIDKSVLEED